MTTAVIILALTVLLLAGLVYYIGFAWSQTHAYARRLEHKILDERERRTRYTLTCDDEPITSP